MGDLCRGNGSTVTMSATVPGRPNTFLTLNTTLTSPTVYMQIEGTWLYNDSATMQSKGSHFWLPQSADAVSSYCGQVGAGAVKQAVEYADFNHPIPARAYRCQPRCFTNHFSLSKYTTTILGETSGVYTLESDNTLPAENLCSTIWDDYVPALSIPAAFTAMKPQIDLGDNVSCHFAFDTNNVFFDPPIPLVRATSVNGPVLTAGKNAITTTSMPSLSAEPAGTLGSSTATNTGLIVSTSTTTAATRSSALPKSQASVPAGTRATDDPDQTEVLDTSQASAGTVESSIPAASQSVTAGDPPSPTSVSSASTRKVGDIIASVFGMICTSSPNTLGAESASASTVNAGPGSVSGSSTAVSS
ncbi:hypothetical protein LTR85_001997 [Meristemomyces frigidus]|nr:hypothetical protein LTR85_001997 [Meristemomyces frigidus]